MKLGTFFPAEKEKIIKPHGRGFYCDLESCDTNTGERKPKFQIYCDFIDKYIEDYYIFIITTSKDYRKTYENFYQFSRDSDLNLLEKNYNRILEDKGYIYPRNSSLTFSECRRIKFPKHINRGRILHIGYINTRKYNDLRKFLEADVLNKLLMNKVNELKTIKFEDEEKEIKSEIFLNSI